MKELIAYSIPFVLFILGLTKDKSKVITFLFAIYFWVLMGLNTYTPDYHSYEQYFLYTSLVDVEPGFKLLCNIFRSIGLTYQQFRMVFAAIYSVLAVISVKRLTKHVNYVLAMFLLIPFVLNVSGIRFALAAMIVCFGIPYLLPDQKHGDIKYIACVLLASTIHVSTLFFLVFLFAKRRYSSVKYFAIGYVVIGIGVLIKTSLLLDLVVTFMPNATILIKWLSLTSSEIGHLNTTGFLLNVFFVIAFPVLITVLTNIMNCEGKKNIEIVSNLREIEDKTKQRLALYKNISIYGLLVIPGYFVSAEYQRFLFGMLIIYYSVFAEFKYTFIKNRYSEKLSLRISYFALTGLLLLLYVYSMQSHDVLATFVDNIIFK